MKKIVIIIALGMALCYANEEYAHKRVKRKVLFTKNSKFFLRLNGKANVIPFNQIFAHGWAFRVNWELPENLPRRHKFFKREINSVTEILKNIQGYSCILKYICHFLTNIRVSQKCGIFCKIGNIISRSQGIDADFFHTIFNQCENYIDECPY